jgi:ABC-type amino acid transport system permease subunit
VNALATSVAGTLALFAVSASTAVALGLGLAAASTTGNRLVRLPARIVVNTTRGIPTVLWVIMAGVAALRLPATGGLPVVFPGTAAPFQTLAWCVAGGLAISSAGHLAEVFRGGLLAIGPVRIDQARVLGLSPVARGALLGRECAAVALPPTAARLTHHLHNTAFAALFPVTELFGYVQAGANRTFQVAEYALLGCLLYIVMTGLIWIVARWLEALLGRRRRWALRVPRP